MRRLCVRAPASGTHAARLASWPNRARCESLCARMFSPETSPRSGDEGFPVFMCTRGKCRGKNSPDPLNSLQDQGNLRVSGVTPYPNPWKKKRENSGTTARNRGVPRIPVHIPRLLACPQESLEGGNSGVSRFRRSPDKGPRFQGVELPLFGILRRGRVSRHTCAGRAKKGHAMCPSLGENYSDNLPASFRLM